MKKILSLIICVVMLMTLAVTANAEALNLAGGCKTEVQIKKANSAAVVKNGEIDPGEYVEVAVNRETAEDSGVDVSDLLLSWNVSDDQGIMLLEECEEFIKDVHFYLSWDEVNGLNMAIKAKLLETPWCATPQPDNSYYGDLGFPGDEFLFQFGAMFSVVADNEIVIYRGLGYNTEEGKSLTGHYGRHGYTGSYNLVERQNYAVKVEGNWVTYEISYPLQSFLKSADINGSAPVNNTKINFNLTATGGSQGEYNSGARTYAISLGDGGYMSSKWAGDALSPAKGYFSMEEIPYTSTTVTTPAATTEPETQIVTSVVTEEVVVTDEAGNTVTDEFGNVVTEVIENVVTEIVTVPSTNAGEGTQSPATGDPMIIAAVVAAISACGIVVAKKRK